MQQYTKNKIMHQYTPKYIKMHKNKSKTTLQTVFLPPVLYTTNSRFWVCKISIF